MLLPQSTVVARSFTMFRNFLRCLFCVWLTLSRVAFAEGGCPPGEVPYTTSTNPGGCWPGPNYGKHEDAPQPYTPPRPKWVNLWGAVASDGQLEHFGTASGKMSRPQAENEALFACRAKGGRQCKVENWYGNSCIATAVGEKGWSSQAAKTLDEAIPLAMQGCRGPANDYDSTCHIYYTACSLPAQN